jgi:transcriptional regulator with XRE-family HTH domain
MTWTNQWDATEQPSAAPLPRPTRGPREGNLFGPMLARLRLARNLSQGRLGSKAGFDHSYISRLESGTRTPSWDAVQIIATELDLSQDDHSRLLAAAGFLPDDLSGLLDPLAVDVQRVLLAVKGTEKEQSVRLLVGMILKLSA